MVLGVVWAHSKERHFQHRCQGEARHDRPSLDEIIKELTWVRNEKPITEKELTEGKGALMKGFPGRFERMSSVASQLVRLVVDGYSPDWYAKWPSAVNAIDLKAASATGQQYTNPEGFAIIVAGDLSKIEESLKGLGRPIRRFDAQGNPVTVAPVSETPASTKP